MIHQTLSSASQWENGKSWLCGQWRWWPFSCRLGRTPDWWDTFCIWQTHTSLCRSWTPTPPAGEIWIRSGALSSIPTSPLYQPTRWHDTSDSGGSETVARCASFQTCAEADYFPFRRIQKSSQSISPHRLRWRWRLPDYRSIHTGLDESWEKRHLFNPRMVFGHFKPFNVLIFLRYLNSIKLWDFWGTFYMNTHTKIMTWL